MIKRYLPKLTSELLQAYSEAALRNADELLAEALLLLDHGHMARAYFLAISCIEEAGKALLAFDSQHRNLTDPAVCTKLRISMEKHEEKINCVLSKWALSNAQPRAALQVALDLMIDLAHGREPAMYSDIRPDPDRAQTPREIIRAKAGHDCVRLAADCLTYARRHVTENSPVRYTGTQDKLFTMKSAKFHEIFNKVDFHWYYIGRQEAGNDDLSQAMIEYEEKYIKTGKFFMSPD